MREGTGLAGGIAALITTFFTAFAALIVGCTYLVVCVYAIVKWIGDADGHPDPATVILGFLAIVTLLVAGLLVGIRFLGGSLNSRKRPEGS